MSDAKHNQRANGEAKSRISIVGSVGIPNRYGGPEAFVESIAPALVNRGFQVQVTCDTNRYRDDLSPQWAGVRRIFIPISANGALSPLHDLLGFLRVVARSDYVLILGVSAGLLFPLLRFVCLLTGTRLLVNIDGVEWRRAKFSLPVKGFLFLSDWLAQRFAHVLIYDNDALLPYVRYPRKRACVEYCGDYAVLGSTVNSDVVPAEDYALTICRIEPENNCDLLIEGFLKSSRSLYLFVGNWERSEYGRALRKRYAGNSRVRLLDPIYDSHKIFQLRTSCTVYLHGHSVGGTNPSLVEILFFECEVLCWDCSFNRVTSADAARYFDSAEDLARLLDQPVTQRVDRSKVRRRYTTEAIVRKLLLALDKSS